MQQVWRKRWTNTGWIALGAVTLVLLVAGVHKKNNKACTGIEVVFNGDGNNFFVDEKGVIAILKANGAAKGLEIEKTNLKALEDRLKQDKWIADAELFFDNKQVLKAHIKEKEPIARIFTSAGSSFYIDSACKKLPLSEKLSARIPMFTSFPSDRQNLSRPDSMLLASVKELAMFIQADEFWKAQVAQVDITPDGFEMIPTVGNHVVALGKDGDYQQKFDRLFSFYKQVWTKVGFERYEKINVQYKGQVVATVKGAKSSIVVDTVKAKEAMEALMANTKPVVDLYANAQTVNVPIPAPVKDTVKVVQVAKPKTITATVLNASKNNLLPKAKNLKAPVKKEAVKQVLSDEEEAIRKEAIKQQLAQQKKEQKEAKQQPKAVVKKKG